MIQNETYKFFLMDLCTLLKEMAVDAHQERKKSEFNDGIAFGYYQVLSLIENQLEAFQIDSKVVKMDDFNSEDLLYKDKLDYPITSKPRLSDKKIKEIIKSWKSK